MKLLLSADRLRSIAAAAGTEKELENLLRSHKIRFTWTTTPGYLCARVPCRSGSMLIYRTCSRSVPFAVRSAEPVKAAGYPYPVLRFAWDD